VTGGRIRRVAALAVAGGLLLGATAGSASAAVSVSTGAAGYPGGVALWNGRVAWIAYDGVYAATPGGAAQRLVALKLLPGFVSEALLDAGNGSGVAAGGSLAYAWQESNSQTPPMGPGDQNVPSPPIAYDDVLAGNGLVGAGGSAVALAACPTGFDSTWNSSAALASSSVYFACGNGSASMLEQVATAQPGVIAQTLPELGSNFAVAGAFLADAEAAGAVVVENLGTGTTAYQVNSPTRADALEAGLSLGSDGTLVAVGEGTGACANGASPTAWYSPSSPAGHQLGCFIPASGPRPIGGEWVGLQPGGGDGASLVLVDLASGATRTLETFANASMFLGADFDGTALAWESETCAGTVVEYAPDIATLTPDPVAPSSCPVDFDVPAVVHAGSGRIRVSLSCPIGCIASEVSLAAPVPLRRLRDAYFSLAPGGQTQVSLHLDKAERAYLARRHRVRVTIHATVAGPPIGALGGARYNGIADSRSQVRFTLVA
jgi:hypothetical protein